MLNLISVKTRLQALIAIPLIAFVAITLTSLNLMGTLVLGIKGINEDRVIPLKLIKSVSDNYAVKIVDDFHKFNADIISKAQLLNELEQAKQLAKSEWKKYTSTQLIQEESELIEKAQAEMYSVLTFLDKTITQLEIAGTLGYSDKEFVKQLYLTFDPLSVTLDKLISLQLSTSQTFADQSFESYKNQKVLLISVSIGLILLSLVLARFIYLSISKPLNGVSELMEEIAKDTNLLIRLPETGNDEFTSAAKSTNSMLNKFKVLIEELREAVNTLGSESEGMSQNSSQLAANADQQHHQTTLIATAITEMSAAISEVATNAINTSNKASESDRIAKQGLEKVSMNIHSINELNEVISLTKIDIDMLCSKSNEINSVVQLIKGVAEQTNLLALNAAIEAARAGESGRGFAVVADEVRQLAHNTQQATGKISEMIIALQEASNRAVSSMEEATNKANKSVSIANDSSLSITAIANAITEIADMNLVVSTATEEQTTVAAEISKNINEFSESIQNATLSASEMASSSLALSQLSSKLSQDIGIFKV